MGFLWAMPLARFYPTFLEVIRAFFLKKKSCKPCVYLPYVDDTFSMFDSINDATDFHTNLSSLQPSIHFTIEVESDGTLLFLDVLVERK